MLNNAEYQRKEMWQKTFPVAVASLLTIGQMIFSGVILGCEIAGMIIDFYRMNAFVGYWVSPILMFAWISLAGASCCCLTRCCGVAALVFQCFAIPMALCVVGFDAYFLANPTQCFFTNSCDLYDYSLSDVSATYSTKVPIIWVQLVAGDLMFVSCIIYIISFEQTNQRVKKLNPLHYSHPAPVTIMPAAFQYGAPHSNPVYGYALGRKLVTRPATIHPVELSRNDYIQPPYNPTSSEIRLTWHTCQTRFPISTEHH